MRYIIADIHGCYEEYRELLSKIQFSDADELYVLGDAMDRGPEPIKVIQDLMAHPNVFYILGNHDYFALGVLPKLIGDIPVENVEDHLDVLDLYVDLHDYATWISEGGTGTITQFLALPDEEKIQIVEYLSSAYSYMTVEHDGKLYILVHAGIRGTDTDKELDEYEVEDFIFGREEYSKPRFPSDRIVLVIGHTPTRYIRNDRNDLAYIENNHIALDCGCVYYGALAAYCIETGEVTYVKSQYRGKGWRYEDRFLPPGIGSNE